MGHRVAQDTRGYIDLLGCSLPISFYSKYVHYAQTQSRLRRKILALEYTTRRLVLTDRARRAVRERVAVRRVLHAEVVTLDDAREALTD